MESYKNIQFSKAELARYDRHIIIPDFGMEAQQKLKAARVLVVGSGGLGSPLLVIAALAGVLGGGVAGWGYRRFVWPQSTIAGRLIAWAVLILVADALSSLVFAIVLPMFDSEMPAFPGSLEAVLGYAAISTAYDIVATTVVMALLPERFRQPLG